MTAMFRFTDRVSEWMRRRRPVTRADFAEIADWVNEGGSLDPAGPPPLVGAEGEPGADSGGA